jgi:glycosyltransferase involved in cell wall biosynthesis
MVCSHDTVQKSDETLILSKYLKGQKNGDCEGICQRNYRSSNFVKPVISTLHSGIPEIVKDGENGFLTGRG